MARHWTPLQHAGVIVVPHVNLLVGGAANLDTDVRDVGGAHKLRCTALQTF